MTQAKHTPGPWQSYCNDFTGTYVASKDPTYDVVCHVKDDGNARLIAAAPELLAALEDLWPQNLGPLPDGQPDSMTIPVDMTFGEIRRARAAIAKAKGETP